MPLPLAKTLKREVLLDGVPHTVAMGPHGVKITAKGFRIGRSLSWRAILALGTEAGPGEPGTDEPAPSAGR